MSLIVKLEIHPGGDASRACVIGQAEICNMSDLAEVSNYSFVLDARLDRPHSYTVRGEVLDHSRSEGAWRLLKRVLNQVF